MRFEYLFFIMVLMHFASCGKKETQKEQLEFTKESIDFTADRSGAAVSPIRLTDITTASGIDFSHVTGAFGEKWMPETIGSGGGFLDYNNDGWPDLFLVNGTYWPGHGSDEISPGPALYENNQDGTFTDVSSKAGINFSIYGMGCSFADYDADGDTDIYITAVGDNLLLQNNDGVFEDVTIKTGVAGKDPDQNSKPVWSTSAAWIDVDRDGWLDLFVGNYVQWSPETDIFTTRDGKTKSYATPDIYKGESCRLFKNVKGQYFKDVTEEAGVLDQEGKSLGVAIADFNNDNWPDIVVSNDTQPNFLYVNNGDGNFTNQAIVSGIAYDESGRARAGMGVDVADIANDGQQAIVIGNFSQEPLSLYTQTKGNIFQDRAGAARLTRASMLQLTFGTQFCDLDNDGFMDLLVANGHIEPEINKVQKNITFEQSPQVFYNDKGIFNDMSDQLGEAFNTPIVGRGIATSDYDRDGDLDVLFTVNGGSPRFFRNDTEAKSHHLTVKLKGKKPNLGAIGAKVVVWHDGIKQNRMIRTGSSYLSQSDIGELIIGLGESENVDSLKITWPTTGKETLMKNISAGKVLTIKEH